MTGQAVDGIRTETSAYACCPDCYIAGVRCAHYSDVQPVEWLVSGPIHSLAES